MTQEWYVSVDCNGTKNMRSLCQNGGYVNPPAVKRSLRDPYEDWWDKQERRNFGEPVHEDNDMLGVFSLEEYNQWSAGKAIKGFLTYGLGIAAFSAAIYYNFPAEKPAVPRTFPNGLKAELGGDGALTVSFPILHHQISNSCPGRVGLDIPFVRNKHPWKTLSIANFDLSSEMVLPANYRRMSLVIKCGTAGSVRK